MLLNVERDEVHDVTPRAPARMGVGSPEGVPPRDGPPEARVGRGVALIVVGAALIAFAFALVGPPEDLSLGIRDFRAAHSLGVVPRSSLGDVVPASTRPAACAHDPAHAPAMSASERETVLKYVRAKFEGATWKDGEAKYLEWGGGGSTSAFGTHAGLVRTVEHVASRCDEIREWPEMRCMRDVGAWELFCHDPGVALGERGLPDSAKTSPDAFSEAMRPYTQGPGRFAPASYDVVLIDGRLRAGCAWSALPYLTRDSVVLWHDYDDDAWDKTPGRGARWNQDRLANDPVPGEWRRMYHRAAARLFDKVEHVGTLAVFRLKPAVAQQFRWLE